MSKPKLLLLDSYALIYRAYHAFADKPITNSKGLITNAPYGFTNTIWDLITKENPSHIAAVFDSEEITDRAAEHEFYKAHREAMPEGISTTLPYIFSILEAMHIPVLKKPGIEADDIIGTLALKKAHEGFEVYIVSSDKDLGQVVKENIYQLKPRFGGSGFDKHNTNDILSKWGLQTVEQIIDLLGLMGDSSDNIPGVPGIGEKTAAKLLTEWGSMENLYANLDSLKGKLKENLTTYREQAFISKKLATILTDIEIEVTNDELKLDAPDADKLANIFAELEFRTLGKRILGDQYSVNRETTAETKSAHSIPDLFNQHDTPAKPLTLFAETESISAGKNISNTPHTYLLAQTPDEIEGLITRCLSQKEVCIDTETTGIDPNNCHLVGISISFVPHEAWYVPVPANREEAQSVVDKFIPLLTNTSIIKIGQNIKFDMIVFRWYGIEVAPPLYDTMLAHYILDPESKHGMDRLAETYLGYSPVSIESLIGKKGKNQGNMRNVNLEEIKDYAAEDADITLQLKNTFYPLIIRNNQQKLLDEIENALVPVLADMEYQGVNIDTRFLAEYSEELADAIHDSEETIYRLAGTRFNLDSPKQLGDVLFLKMGIPYKGKKTKTGQFSTGEDVLQSLSMHEIAQYVLDYRELTKLKSTYVDAIPSLINPKTKRIHSTFNQAVAATGRLSSTNPNLQNIPIRTERGKKIRKAFIPREGQYTILSADYSQIELRLIASVSNDEAMMKAFRDGLDIHASTAALVYHTPLQEITPSMRRNAKAVNFGIIYGTTAYGLSQNIGISKHEAQQLIDNYFKEFSGIRQYMEQTKEFARTHGYVETLCGRRRYLPDINSANRVIREAAERNAINAPIQGSAADMIKIAMIRVFNRLRQENCRSLMTLQVHDELVFDVDIEELEKVTNIVKEEMQLAMSLSVPLVVDTGSGSDWLSAH